MAVNLYWADVHRGVGPQSHDVSRHARGEGQVRGLDPACIGALVVNPSSVRTHVVLLALLAELRARVADDATLPALYGEA